MIVINGYIIAVQSGDENEAEIRERIASKPQDVDGNQYKLRADTLEWELVELPPIDDTDDEATESDYIDALKNLGVEVDE